MFGAITVLRSIKQLCDLAASSGALWFQCALRPLLNTIWLFVHIVRHHSNVNYFLPCRKQTWACSEQYKPAIFPRSQISVEPFPSLPKSEVSATNQTAVLLCISSFRSHFVALISVVVVAVYCRNRIIVPVLNRVPPRRLSTFELSHRT